MRPAGVIMLHLDSLSIRRFKSFKSADLLFSSGFTCIVGPNGSGKSNICDALLFGLGENSLHRLRVERLESLINNASRKQRQAELPKAYVRVGLSGDENYEILRVARADGKSVFKVNGKRMTRQEVLEILKKHKVNANETNTITQGEINKIMDLNPKERRELIDIAAGIKEFEDKKQESMKELEKVSMHIGEMQIMLNERIGFLKELEKEKEAAEKYAGLSSRLKSLSYSIIVKREHEAREEFNRHSKDMALLDAEKQKLQGSIDECSKKIADLSSSRQLLTKWLNESTASMGAVSKNLESIGNGLAALGVELQNIDKEIMEKSGIVEGYKISISEANASMEKNNGEIEASNASINAIEAKAKGIGVADADYSSIEKKMSEAQRTLTSAENALANALAKLSGIDAEARSLQGISKTREEAMFAASRKSESLASKIKDMKAEIEKISKDDSIAAKINGVEANAAALKRELGQIDERLLALKEERAAMKPWGIGILEKIASRFTENDGFYGSASQLCSYPTDYANAVETAAGSRFDYLVVESMDVASRIIEYLKKNGLGRATFIPLKELRLGRPEAEEAAISKVISVVKFEKKYSGVFEYLFSNTYIIGEVADAKKFGVGKHRYVTLGGELVEASGIISGGSVPKKRLSISSIEREIAAATAKKTELLRYAEELEINAFNMRKQAASIEIAISAKNAELSNLEVRYKELQDNAESMRSAAASEKQRADELEGKRRECEAEKAAIEKQLEAAKQAYSALYHESVELSKAVSHGVSKEELEKNESRRKEAEALKIKKAELQKENQLLAKQIHDTESKMVETTGAVSALKNRLIELAKKKQKLEADKAETESKIRSSSEKNRKAYEELDSIDAQVAKQSEESGRLNAGMENLKRRLEDIKLRRSQIEVRLEDLTAEIAAYPEKPELIDAGTDEMEKESLLVKGELEKLGTVNMKAPEIYAEKKNDVDAVSAKISTLGEEKDAVLRMIDEIDTKKLRVFLDTFEKVNKNFSKLYNYIFPDSARIELDDLKDPFSSGLRIMISNGSRGRNLDSLSGGEKSLTMLMLIFAIHMYKPSSLYIFDEVDASLDKENSKKLSQLIKELSKGSQFIVVSHNDSLITNTDIAVGVTKVNDESRAIGLQTSEIINRKPPEGRVSAAKGA